MTGLHTYTLRGESEAALIAVLEAAQTGKARPFVFDTEEGKTVDPARITFPREEMTAGILDPDTGEYTEAPEPTGMWVCEVRLMEPCAALAEIAEAP